MPARSLRSRAFRTSEAAGLCHRVDSRRGWRKVADCSIASNPIPRRQSLHQQWFDLAPASELWEPEWQFRWLRLFWRRPPQTLLRIFPCRRRPFSRDDGQITVTVGESMEARRMMTTLDQVMEASCWSHSFARTPQSCLDARCSI